MVIYSLHITLASCDLSLPSCYRKTLTSYFSGVRFYHACAQSMPSATQPEAAIEVVAWEQAWKEIDNDEPVFDHIRVIFRRGSRYLFARQQDRYAPIDATKLHLEEIPDAFLYAPVPASLTRAPDPLPANSYLKEPNLLDFGETSNCCIVLLQEAEIYELLRQHPHPNIARYYGCVAENDRFRGICLQRYSITLKQRVERPANGKDKHQPALTKTERQGLMQGIRSGVAHLDSPWVWCTTT